VPSKDIAASYTDGVVIQTAIQVQKKRRKIFSGAFLFTSSVLR